MSPLRPAAPARLALKNATENLPSPGVMQDIQAAIRHASQAGKVGIVGFCYGGLLTWRSACMLDGLAAAVPYYGGGVTTPDEVARSPKCPVLAHFGDQDHWIPLESVIEFKRDVYHQALCELSRFVPSVVAARPDRGVPPAATPRHHPEMTGRSEPSTLASPASST